MPRLSVYMVDLIDSRGIVQCGISWPYPLIFFLILCFKHVRSLAPFFTSFLRKSHFLADFQIALISIMR